MAIPLTINGATFEYPQNFDENWGVEATGWAQAVTNGMLQMSGGSFPLTSDINFGPNFGLLSKYFETRSSNPATTGTVRLSSADAGVAFRNNANSGNLVLTTDASDNLKFNGTTISGGVNNGTQFKLGYYATTSNTISPNPNTTAATQALVTDANGVPTTTGNGGTTAIEIGYVSGVTSALQTQINNKLSLSGGTMSGNIAMGSNKVTGLAAPSTAGDALSQGAVASVTTLTVTTVINNDFTNTVHSASDTATNTGDAAIYAIRDTTNGGYCLVLFENLTTPVIVAQAGVTTFVTGSPGATQIQVKAGTSGAGLVLRAGSSRDGANVAITQINTQS